MCREVPVYLKIPYSGKTTPDADGLSPSHALLARAAALYTGRAPEAFTALSHEPRGKPSFTAYPEVRFSVSHSADLWACAVDGETLGLDVQAFEGRDVQRIARRFFHPLEQAYVDAHGYEAFFYVWAAKESYCKYTGTGIDGTFSRFTVSDGERLLAQTDGAWLFPFIPRAGFIACLCTEEKAVARLVML